MDLNALLRLVFLEKNDITFGVLTGLLLIVLIWLLVRSVVEEKSSSAQPTQGGAALDTTAINNAIEGALKKALGDNAIVASAPAVVAVAAPGEISADAQELKKTLNEREAKISALMSDLEAVKGQIDKSTSAGSSEDTSALHTKIKELQAKLAEYEIIEDDIADLSIFKEENKKLKDEVDKLRAAVETAKSQVQTVQAAAEAPLVDKIQAAQEAVVAVEETAEPPSALDAFKLDPEDDVMVEFSQAVVSERTKPPLESNLISGSGAELEDPKAAMEALFADAEPATEATVAEPPADSFGELDTEKMLAEVATLKEATANLDSSSVLDEQLDTDRLMAEMGMVETPMQVDAAPEAVEVPVEVPTVDAEPPPEVAREAPPVALSPERMAALNPEIDETDIPVDDLLAEFKDTDLLKGTKGS